MKSLLAVSMFALLLGCGSAGPPTPRWKTDAADLAGRYKQHALLGENALAERYFRQAVMATGGAGRVADTARLWLMHCATRRAMLLDDDCHEYAELARFARRDDDDAYYQFVTLAWNAVDAGRLPRHYAALLRTGPATVNGAIRAIDDPLSRLLAASLVVLRGQADDATLALAAETASAQGWRQPLLVYLKLLEKRAAARADTAAQAAYAQRIQLIEAAIRASNDVK